MTTNILNKEDPFYRYKRDIIQIRQDKSNKTYLLNIEAIAEQLDRSANLFIKYLQYKLNIPTNTKKQYIQGNYTVKDIEGFIDEFAEEMVACKVCGNPETKTKVKKGAIYLKCASCGKKSAMKVGSKLEKFIMSSK